MGINLRRILQSSQLFYLDARHFGPGVASRENSRLPRLSIWAEIFSPGSPYCAVEGVRTPQVKASTIESGAETLSFVVRSIFLIYVTFVPVLFSLSTCVIKWIV